MLVCCLPGLFSVGRHQPAQSSPGDRQAAGDSGATPMKRGKQRSLYCSCGRDKIIASGHCATCYTLRRQDAAYFSGLREMVLARDGYACRACGASGRDKRSITVHHRIPGKSLLPLMISLCPGCHAKVHRTQAVLAQMPALLLELWREQHPHGHEQTFLNFAPTPKPLAMVPLFPLREETRSAFGA